MNSFISNTISHSHSAAVNAPGEVSVTLTEGPLGVNLQSAEGGRGAFIESFYRGRGGSRHEAERSEKISIGDRVLCIAEEYVFLCELSDIHTKLLQAERPTTVRFLKSRHSLSTLSVQDIATDPRATVWVESYLQDYCSSADAATFRLQLQFLADSQRILSYDWIARNECPQHARHSPAQRTALAALCEACLSRLLPAYAPPASCSPMAAVRSQETTCPPVLEHWANLNAAQWQHKEAKGAEVKATSCTGTMWPAPRGTSSLEALSAACMRDRTSLQQLLDIVRQVREFVQSELRGFELKFGQSAPYQRMAGYLSGMAPATGLGPQALCWRHVLSSAALTTALYVHATTSNQRCGGVRLTLALALIAVLYCCAILLCHAKLLRSIAIINLCPCFCIYSALACHLN